MAESGATQESSTDARPTSHTGSVSIKDFFGLFAGVALLISGGIAYGSATARLTVVENQFAKLSTQVDAVREDLADAEGTIKLLQSQITTIAIQPKPDAIATLCADLARRRPEARGKTAKGVNEAIAGLGCPSRNKAT